LELADAMQRVKGNLKPKSGVFGQKTLKIARKQAKNRPFFMPGKDAQWPARCSFRAS
jgi:hypothetical protein